MVTIYNVATGEPKTLDMVDAREHVASGRWGFGLPEPIDLRSDMVDTTSAEAYDERLEAFNAAMQVAASSPQAQTYPQVRARRARR